MPINKNKQRNKLVIGGLVLATVVLATVVMVWQNLAGTDSAEVVFAQLIGTDKPGKDGLLPINDPLFQMYQKWLATADELNRVNQQIAQIKKETDLERWEKLQERKTTLERGLLKIDVEAVEYELKKETDPARRKLLEDFLKQKQEVLKYLNEHGELPPLLPAPPKSSLPSPRQIIEKEKRKFDEELEKQRRLLEEIKKPQRPKEIFPSSSNKERPNQTTSNVCDELKRNLGYQPVQRWKKNAGSREFLIKFFEHSRWQVDMMKRVGASKESVAESEIIQIVKDQSVWLWKEMDELVADAESMDKLSPADQMKFAILMELNNAINRRLGIMQDLFVLRGDRKPLKIVGPSERALKEYNDMMKKIRIDTYKELSGSNLSDQLNQIDKRIKEIERIIRDPDQKQRAIEWGRLWGELQLLKQTLEEAIAYLAATPEP